MSVIVLSVNSKYLTHTLTIQHGEITHLTLTSNPLDPRDEPSTIDLRAKDAHATILLDGSRSLAYSHINSPN